MRAAVYLETCTVGWTGRKLGVGRCDYVDNGLRSFIKNVENYSKSVAEQTLSWQNDSPEHKVYLYGAGYLMQYYVRYLQEFNIQIEKIIDSEKDGNYKGIEICKYDDFLKENPNPVNCRFFISTARFAKDIRTILKKTFIPETIFFVEWGFQFEFVDMSLNEYRQYLDNHWNEIENLENSLCDEMSKRTLEGILKEYVSGNPSFIEDIIDPDLGYPRGVIKFGPNEIFVELGSNNGDTFKDFVKHCPDYHKAWLFEPADQYQEELEAIKRTEGCKGKIINIIKKGAWDKEETLRFLATGEGSGTTFTERNLEGDYIEIEAATVDGTVTDAATFIKMDIEGAELRALRGAAEQIKNNHPKLAISIYHRCSDLIDIWTYLRNLVPDYRFYLRAHTPLWDDIYLYAV